MPLSTPGFLNLSPNLPIPRTQPFTFTKKQKHQHNRCSLPNCIPPSLVLEPPLASPPLVTPALSVPSGVLRSHAPSQEHPALPVFLPVSHSTLICASVVPTYAPTTPGNDLRDVCGLTVLSVTVTQSSLAWSAHICCLFCGVFLGFPLPIKRLLFL